MPGILDFVKRTFQYRTSYTMLDTYTALSTDERINFTGAAAKTLTLPTLVMSRVTFAEKGYLIENNSAYALTVVPATATPTQTVGGRSSLVLNPGEYTVVNGQINGTDWEILFPSPRPAGLKNIIPLIATTSGTAAINLCDSDGAVADGTIVSILTIAQDTNAGNIVVANAGNTVATIAKSTTAGLPVGDSSLANTDVALGNVLTVASSTTNGNAKVIVNFAVQQMVRE